MPNNSSKPTPPHGVALQRCLTPTTVKLFEFNTPDLLAKRIVAEQVGAVSLASYCFAIQIGDISITCNDRVFASIGGATFIWEEAPSNAPWGLLVRQRVSSVEFTSPGLLRITLEGDDYLEIESVKGPYESVLIEFPRQGDEIVMNDY